MSFLTDPNLWDILAMPFGLTLCFGPALVVWLRAELRDQPSPKDREKH
jgi:hypothetical protein